MSLSELPLASGRQHKKVFERKFGFICKREANHIIMKRSGEQISIPNHDEVKRQTLKRILADAHISDAD